MNLNLAENINFKKAYDYAAYLLSLRLRTEGELRDKLKVKKFDPATVNSVLDRLKEQKYVNDQSFAEVYLENLKKYKNFGYFGIKKKLFQKKLSEDIIADVLGQGLSTEEELIIGNRILNREKAALRPASGDKSLAKLKLAQKLKARGFRSQTIIELLK
jgi:regulatory protein